MLCLTCTAAMHISQILYAWQFFCHFLSHGAFTLCVKITLYQSLFTNISVCAVKVKSMLV